MSEIIQGPRATITSTDPRYANWLEVFGSATIPIVSAVPHYGTAPGVDGVAQFYRVDTAALTYEVRSRIVAFIARQFGVDPSEVWTTLDDPEHGIPILADNVSVMFDARMML